MTIINKISNMTGDLIFGQLPFTSSWPALLVAAFVLALVALLVFKFCSRQEALRRSKAVMFGRLLEIRVFKDDLWGIFATFGRIVAAIFRYMGHTLRPLAVLILPLGLFLVQAAGWFENRPLQSGETALFTVRLEQAAELQAEDVSLSVSSGLEVETDVFMAPAGDELAWRILVGPRHVREGRGVNDQWVEVGVDDRSFRKSVSVTPRFQRVSGQRVRGGSWRTLKYPGEDPIPAGAPMISMRINYPARKLEIGSMDVNWLLALFVTSLLFGLILKRPLRVEF